jgi:hypothetical protein
MHTHTHTHTNTHTHKIYIPNYNNVYIYIYIYIWIYTYIYMSATYSSADSVRCWIRPNNALSQQRTLPTTHSGFGLTTHPRGGGILFSRYICDILFFCISADEQRCMYVCMYAYIYICIYTYIYMSATYSSSAYLQTSRYICDIC